MVACAAPHKRCKRIFMRDCRIMPYSAVSYSAGKIRGQERGNKQFSSECVSLPRHLPRRSCVQRSLVRNLATLLLFDEVLLLGRHRVCIFRVAQETEELIVLEAAVAVFIY